MCPEETMTPLFVLFLVPGGIDTVPSPDFSKDQQVAAVVATVRVVNPARERTGSGVVIGSEGPFVYVLTVAHVVARAEGLEVHTFSATSYPEPAHVYDAARVVARAGGLDDLALVRVLMRDRPPGTVRVCPPRLLPTEKALPVLTVGCAEGEAPTCAIDTATRKRVRRGNDTGELWEMKHKPDPGRSGGPLIDRRGWLLGVGSGANNDKGYGCTVEAIHAFLKENGYRTLYEEAP
jgi:S1-C subfamily serine protease